MALELRRDPLAGMRRIARDYGDIVSFHVLMQDRILLNHPDWINQVLVIQQSKFHKSELTRRITGADARAGIADQRRRLLAAAAAPGAARVSSRPHQRICRDDARNRAGPHPRWRDGEERNMAQEMTALTLDIAVRTLFGTTLPGEAHQVGRAMTFLMRYSLQRQRLPFRIPETWPTPEQSPREPGACLYRLARLPNHFRAARGGKFQSSQRSALAADGSDGRRRQPDDAAAAPRRDDDAFYCGA